MSEQSMNGSDGGEGPHWTRSVYYAESLVSCTLEDAWKLMLDYRSWNPDFANAEVSLLRGEAGTEGEVVLIRLVDGNRTPVAEFHAETVKLVAPRHIVWYVNGDTFKNFVDFWLAEVPSGVKFSIYYYAQNQMSAGTALAQLRTDTQASLDNLTIAFKNFCARHA